MSKNIATLLSSKVADCLLVPSKESKDTQVKNNENCKQKLSNIELSGLQYVGGYVLHNLHRKLSQAKVKTPENEQAMSILKAGEAGDKLENHKLISSLNRGGLWAVTRGAQLIFERSEHYFRLASSDWTTHKIDCSCVVSKTVADADVVTAYSN